LKLGTLYLIPNVIAEATQQSVIPNQVIEVLKSLRFFLAEDVRTARRYFSSLKIFDSIERLHFTVLDKETAVSDLSLIMKPLLEGYDLGIVSESGCPGVADPGAIAVRFAHQHMIKVVPLVGPSSILLALMSSGLNGQQFAFHGYLPIEAKEASVKIKELEKESSMKNQTQIFIETPFRNNSLLTNLIKSLKPSTILCIAMDLTSPQEQIVSKSVREWAKEPLQLAKVNTVFLFLGN
jgi:16S rRNA (cytidine1402-2'-O)-methyltransferase